MRRKPKPKNQEVETLRKLATELAAQLLHGARLMERLAPALADDGHFDLAEDASDWSNTVIGSIKGAIANASEVRS